MDEQVLKPREMKFSFKHNYKPDDSEDSENDDEILSSKVNLDEADKFIASLKIPKVKKKEQKEERPAAPFVPLDLTVFKEETEKLTKIRMRESQGESESEQSEEYSS